MSNTEVEKQPPSRGSKHICVPFDNEAQYQACVAEVAQYRAYLTTLFARYPELFPQAMGQGYTFHDCYLSRKQGVVLRRIKLKVSKAVFTLRPSFVLPYCIARTDEVEKVLYVRHWGVPFEALAYVFGRNAMFWYRAWLSLGRPNLVGTTVKSLDQIPPHAPQDNFPFELTPLEVDHTAPPPPHWPWRSIAETPLDENLRQNLSVTPETIDSPVRALFAVIVPVAPAWWFLNAPLVRKKVFHKERPGIFMGEVNCGEVLGLEE